MELAAKTKEAARSHLRASLRSTLRMQGIGVHSGNKVKVKMESAPPGTGIIFRSQNKTEGDIPLSPFAVIDTRNAVSLGNGRWSVQTIEHLLAALYGAGITDLCIILDQTELPILDGSAYPWYEAIVETGIEYDQTELRPIALQTAVWVVEGDKYLIALPQEHLSVHYSIHYKHPLLSEQSLYMDLDEPLKIAKEILPARTFGFLDDVEYMKAQGLIKGASINNAIVLTKDSYLNKNLRFPDECVRHKVLDLLGDMYLLGRPLDAHLIAHKAGHVLDVALARKILEHINEDELAQYRSKSCQ